MYTNSSMEPIRSVCPCFGGRSPVAIDDLTKEVSRRSMVRKQLRTLNISSRPVLDVEGKS